MRELPPCRSCGARALQPFLDLGKTPLADALVAADRRRARRRGVPARSRVLPRVQPRADPGRGAIPRSCSSRTTSTSRASPTTCSSTRAPHAVGLVEQRNLGPDSLVVELASNDGYLLKNFVEHGVPVLGIDPAPDQAEAAEAIGVPTLAEFFGAELATKLVDEGKRADVIIANNVMAHVPDLNGFVEGMAILLRDDGVVTIENPYVRDLIEHAEFDTIYHEHFCYFSCTAVQALARAARSPPQPRRVLPEPPRGHAPLVAREARRAIRGRPAVPRRRSRVGHDRLRVLPQLRRPASTRSGTPCSPSCVELRDAGRVDRRVRSGRQGQHAAQLRGDRSRARRLRRGPQRAQAGPVHAGRPPADPGAGRAASSDVPTTCCCSRGTSRRRSAVSRPSTSAAEGASSCRSRYQRFADGPQAGSRCRYRGCRCRGCRPGARVRAPDARRARP